MVQRTVVRMGPPPRSLAAGANGCFMVGSDVGPTGYKVVARCCAPKMAGSPRFVFRPRLRTSVHFERHQAEIRLTPKSPYKFWPTWRKRGLLQTSFDRRPPAGVLMGIDPTT